MENGNIIKNGDIMKNLRVSSLNLSLLTLLSAIIWTAPSFGADAKGLNPAKTIRAATKRYTETQDQGVQTGAVREILAALEGLEPNEANEDVINRLAGKFLDRAERRSNRQENLVAVKTKLTGLAPAAVAAKAEARQAEAAAAAEPAVAPIPVRRVPKSQAEVIPTDRAGVGPAVAAAARPASVPAPAKRSADAQTTPVDQARAARDAELAQMRQARATRLAVAAAAAETGQAEAAAAAPAPAVVVEEVRQATEGARPAVVAAAAVRQAEREVVAAEADLLNLGEAAPAPAAAAPAPEIKVSPELAGLGVAIGQAAAAPERRAEADVPAGSVLSAEDLAAQIRAAYPAAAAPAAERRAAAEARQAEREEAADPFGGLNAEVAQAEETARRAQAEEKAAADAALLAGLNELGSGARPKLERRALFRQKSDDLLGVDFVPAPAPAPVDDIFGSGIVAPAAAPAPASASAPVDDIFGSGIAAPAAAPLFKGDDDFDPFSAGSGSYTPPLYVPEAGARHGRGGGVRG